jgi:hypothetical protein
MFNNLPTDTGTLMFGGFFLGVILLSAYCRLMVEIRESKERRNKNK